MPDPGPRKGRRRAVANDMRRKIEAALRVADAAEELAKAAQALLSAADSGRSDLVSNGLDALRAALARYHAVGPGASWPD